MVLRFFVGNDGASFRLRASKPGFDALTDDLTKLSLQENMVPMVPLYSGLVYCPVGWTIIPLGRSFSIAPMVILKSSANTLTAQMPNACFARLNLNDGNLHINNSHTVPVTVKYAVYAPI